MKSERVTVVLEIELVKKLHDKQAKQIKDSIKSVSFSKVVNDVIRKGIK